ncbi:metallophosphoesterase [Peribacillus alkalitolerans]|uniref:metallophosphoesterase n=1 Tax=Peribacillus alkalitolerans TaxID=1550385 RepID=UPI0013D2322E|nr:metallophosphoesterase [Peribacillus alkalitolerans]
MKEKYSRRSFIKKSAVGILSVIGAGFSSKYYAEEIETKWIEITSHNLRIPNLPASFSGLRAVLFSDTHLGFQFQLSQLEKLIDKINHLRPDLIFFTGDLMDNPRTYIEKDSISPILSKLHAKLGKFCVYGNHDHGGYGSDLYLKIMKESGFIVLKNQATDIFNTSGEKIYIAGVDDSMLGKPNLSQTIQGIPSDSFIVLLSHAPDFAQTASKYPISIQLSGHSHGGQIQIPFYGALITPPQAKLYIDGLYNINEMKLYVNRGLGTTRLPYRFLSRPEITILKFI